MSRRRHAQHYARTYRGRAFMLLLVMAAGCQPKPEAATLHYVGSAACGECHAAALDLVAGTAHPLAMQPVGESSVLGRFDGASIDHYGEPSGFRREGGRWLVRTAGVTGAQEEFEITHTLGVYPLQQYLVAFPGGRYQVLPLAWDARAAAEGGQRWFHVYPDEPIRHTDGLHWTGPQQTWNYMCAECHVTGFQRNYELEADRYETTWHELGVGCEGCHGPGSAHVAWARSHPGQRTSDETVTGGSGLPVDLGTGGAQWTFHGTAPIARRTPPLAHNVQAETCGVCHSRRETLVTSYLPGRPLLATHRPVLLDEGLYYADGQMQDEVYEYGSFLQSRMYRSGVTCSDCHHPSTQEVAPGNLACAKCHQPATYDTPAHHFHEPGSTGASCVACHMPPRTYMVVDPRHDHSIRSPRPDLSLRIGTPNACTTCHADRTDEWAARAVERTWGAPVPARHYGDVLDAGRRALPHADTALVRLAADTGAAGIVRATAVSLLSRNAAPGAARAIEVAARDAEPLVRLAAAASSEVLAPDVRLRAVSHLLTDSLLAVRIETARVLAAVPDHHMTHAQRAADSVASAEYIAAQLVNAERPESHVRLGVFHLQRGDVPRAERHYRHAIRLGPRYPAGYVNLADLFRALGREAEGEQVLRAGLENAVGPGSLHHSLGLLLVRTRRLDEAVEHLAKAVELEPDMPRFAHVYAVALHASGRPAEALQVLERALRRAPHDRELDAARRELRADRPGNGAKP